MLWYPHFSKEEMGCRGTRCDCRGLGLPTPQLMARLESLRKVYGKPIKIYSGYRCPSYNASVTASGEDGPHTTGKAVDIGCYGFEAFELIILALQLGFTGLGLKQHGNFSGRYVHLDLLTMEEGYPRPNVWSYP